jgi:hypothetical protein
MSEFGDFSPLDLGDETQVPLPIERERREFREELFTIVRLIGDPVDRKTAAKAAVKLVEVKYG